MKNRKREICTSGSVRDEDGQPPHLLGHRRQFLHLAAAAAALPAVSRFALVRLKVDVIVGIGTIAPLAAKRATTTIPIVMTAAGDPLGSGLVASLARPGGNVTGMSLMAPELGGKRLELLKELLPRLARVAVLWIAANP